MYYSLQERSDLGIGIKHDNILGLIISQFKCIHEDGW
jgi:hypothetical protein